MSCCLRCLHPVSGCVSSSSDSVSNPSFLLMYTMIGSRWWRRSWETWNSHGILSFLHQPGLVQATVGTVGERTSRKKISISCFLYLFLSSFHIIIILENHNSSIIRQREHVRVKIWKALEYSGKVLLRTSLLQRVPKRFPSMSLFRHYLFHKFTFLLSISYLHFWFLEKWCYNMKNMSNRKTCRDGR